MNRSVAIVWQASEITRETLQPVGREVERGDPGAGIGKLRGLAAGRGAAIEGGFARELSEQARRHRGGGVLNPPDTVGKAGQFSDVARRSGEAKRARRQDDGPELFRPFVGFRRFVGLQCQIDRRFQPVAGIDGGSCFRAVNRIQSIGEPLRRTNGMLGKLRQQRVLFAGRAPEQCVDETGETPRARISLRGCNGEVDGAVIGHIEEQDLGKARQEDIAQTRRAGRKRLFGEPGNRRVEFTKVAKRREQDRAHKRAVTRLQRQILRMAVGLVGEPVHGGFGIENRAKNAVRRLPRGQARLVGGRSGGVRSAAFVRSPLAMRNVQPHGPFLPPPPSRPHRV